MANNNYERMTVPMLKNLARERGLRGYSRLRKAELIQRLRASRDQILDQGIDARMANVPFLTPTPYTPPQATPSPSSNAVEDLINYLNNVKEIPKSVSPRLKKLQEEIDSIYEQMKTFEVRESNSTLRNFAKVYTIDGKLGFDPRSFLDGVKQNITSVLRNNRRTKVKLIFKCYMQRLKTNEIKPANFHSGIEVNLDGTDEKELYGMMVERILEKIAAYLVTDSEVRFYKVIELELHTVSCKPLRGKTWIPLPKELADEKAIINVQNEDNKCFLWCVLRVLNPKEHNPRRLDKKLKGKENTLNMEGICYPVSLKDLNKFEKQNPTISITVLGYEGKSVYPLGNSDNTDREHNIILMLIEEGGVKHYCLIQDLSRLLSSQATKGKRKEYFCMRYLNPFGCQEALNRHLEYCSKYKAVEIKMPEEGTILKFKNYDRREKVPFIVYFECFIEPLQSCDADDKESYTKQYQNHEPSSFCYCIKCFDDEVYEPKLVSYTGENAAQKIVKMLEENIEIITNIPEKKIIFNIQKQKQYEKETNCWICNKKFDDDKNYKVSDHCHFTGRYRGAAHNSCNLRYRKPKVTPVVFIKNLGFSESNIDCIPNSEERYISFTKSLQVGSYTNK